MHQKPVASSTLPTTSATSSSAATRAPIHRLLAPATLITLAILLLPMLIFFSECAGSRVFDNHDLWLYFYPYRQFVVNAARAGEWPLWNPYAFAGIPLLGDGQTAVFFPPNWLAYGMAVPHAVSLAIVLNFSIAGVGMYGWCRSMRLGAGAAAIGAIAYGLNGFLAARIGHQSIMAGAALIPWVFWGFQLLRSGGVRSGCTRSGCTRSGSTRTGGVLLLAFAFAAQVMTGHPQMPAYTALAIMLYAVIDACWRRSWNAWFGLIGAAMLALAISAAQWAPWIALARASPRAAGASYHFVAGDAMGGVDWLLYLFPFAYGGAQGSLVNDAFVNDLFYRVGERLAYVGLLPLMLGLYAIVDAALAGIFHLAGKADENRSVFTQPTWKASHGDVIALSAIAAVMALIASGENTPFGRVVYLIPMLGKLRNMTRALGVLAFCLCALAAIGAERLSPRPRIPAALGCALIVCGGVIASLAIATWSDAPSPRSAPMYRLILSMTLRWDRSNGYIPLICAATSALAMGLLIFKNAWPTQALAVLVVALDVGAVAANYQPTTDPSVYAAVPLAAKFLLNQPGVFRVINLDPGLDIPPLRHSANALLGTWSTHFGVEDVNGYNSLQPRRNLDLLISPNAEDISYGDFVGVDRLAAGRPLAGLFNVGFALLPRDCHAAAPAGWPQVYRDADVTIFQNPSVTLRVHFADRVLLQPDPAAELATVTADDFDPMRQATVDLGLDVQQAASLSHGDAQDTVRITARSLNAMQIQTSTSAPRLVVISQNYFPGWHVTLDANGAAPQSLPLLRADYAFSALIVPAGTHTIDLRYQPVEVWIGLCVSAIGLLTAIGLAVRSKRMASAQHLSAEDLH